MPEDNEQEGQVKLQEQQVQAVLQNPGQGKGREQNFEDFMRAMMVMYQKQISG